MLTFFLQSANPVVVAFMYDLFTDIALLLTLYYMAGLYFSRGKPARVRFLGGMTLFFGMISLLGPQFFLLLGNNSASLPQLHFIKTYGGQTAVVDVAILAFVLLYGASALLVSGRVSLAEEIASADDEAPDGGVEPESIPEPDQPEE